MTMDRLFSMVLTLVLCFTTTLYQAEAQQHVSGSNGAPAPAGATSAINLSMLLAQQRKGKPRGFSLMAESRNTVSSGAGLNIIPAAAGNLTVTGSGTLGRLTKWIGFTSSNSAIGDTTIFEDKNGNVGIGTDGPRAKLEVVRRDGGIALFVTNDGEGSVGIVGEAPNNGIGVQGFANEGDGVFGLTDSFDPPHPGGPAGVSGSAGLFLGGGLAGRFNGVVRIERLFSFLNPGVVLQPGDLAVEGKLNVSGTKNFKIDHPLDPENKYLYHAAIESSEVLNFYSGNVQLNEKGEAVVRMPDWFQALNRDFRYSLTPLGAAMPGLHVAEKISENVFKIAGGAANSEVSWQVIGIRSDPVMLKSPFVVEEEKPERERGRYLNHDAYDLPPDKSIHWDGLSHREQQASQHLKSARIEPEQKHKQQ
ncbi:MAG TPA: hypothetical protein VGV87_23540 [Blastocatellia bacterium]|nr:hypothetical protein [Blastocatellia bacterium]